jgi:hypothetical protein
VVDRADAALALGDASPRPIQLRHPLLVQHAAVDYARLLKQRLTATATPAMRVTIAVSVVEVLLVLLVLFAVAGAVRLDSAGHVYVTNSGNVQLVARQVRSRCHEDVSSEGTVG